MILFRGDIRKSSKKPTYQEITRRLRRFLERKEPELVRIVARFLDGQSKAITYQEIRRLIEMEIAMQGSAAYQIESNFMMAWRQEYAQFIRDELAPRWHEAMEAAAQEITERYNDFYFDPTAENIQRWTGVHSAELVVQITDGQFKALNALVQKAATLQDMTVDALAMVIRPTVGLYPGQATANFNYFRNVRKSLLDANPQMRLETAEKRAAALARKYAEKQHRYRATLIARNELAVAYKEGQRLSIEQAQTKGLIGPCERVWMAAKDDDVCEICRAMDGKRAKEGLPFILPNGSTTYTAHAHIQCRCDALYEEIENG